MKKQLYVIAYDISDDWRRQQVIKLIEQSGSRINRSVFECMLTIQEVKKLIDLLNAIIYFKEDTIVIYSVCKNCYAKTFYLPRNRKIVSKQVVVV